MSKTSTLFSEHFDHLHTDSQSPEWSSLCQQVTWFFIFNITSHSLLSYSRNAKNLNPLRAADFSANLSRATEEFSQNNKNLTEQSLDLILAVIHLAYKKMIHKKFVLNLAQNSNLK